MRAASAADDPGACPKRLPAREHHPVFTGRLGAIGTEFEHTMPWLYQLPTARQCSAERFRTSVTGWGGHGHGCLVAKAAT
jgi:hypothetical protein